MISATESQNGRLLDAALKESLVGSQATLAPTLVLKMIGAQYSVPHTLQKCPFVAPGDQVKIELSPKSRMTIENDVAA